MNWYRRVSGFVRVSGMLVSLLVPLTARQATAEGVGEVVPLNSCLERNQTIRAQVLNGQSGGAESAISAVLADRSDPSCAGLILANLAATLFVSGRFGEAERLAERAVGILEKCYAPEDRVLLNPLQILAGARFEQGKTAKAREAFQRMRRVRIERPGDDAKVRGMAGVFLQSEGRLQEAESEYLAAVRAWEQAGRGDSADAGAALNSLGSVYIEEHRFHDALRTLDRAMVNFTHAPDAVPMDRIKLLNVRATLHAQQGEWREAEQDLGDAVSIADGEPQLTPAARAFLLANYARALRKNHRGREARLMDARAGALRGGGASDAVVDVSELLPKPKSAKK